ncbi:hypothetical protein COT94_04195 [Candidatus Falkowbacteria bacterium CG10_big_fil_rev_8_21_14_0_10_37_14]|uniref:DUF192 domain-containing protein n=1 Tax=Candidatus Falkowbacteria bacterium CG10_big_fil_rev_8_21_14_0_10_37_14 TaxID=1974561 RepID=A0A2M6WSH8_9BACT|nr:DUF192 domain-containing protein [Candidatus Falkowbacteria bacterium]PIT95759.1 MAG: hypothetical protein COT94_04195 [Candidatus Falkowbacteria bacterium CG10_big_fil_rev_8_21_14_0_10_37_14]
MKYLCLVLFCLLLLAGCSQVVSQPQAATIIIGSTIIQVEVADNDATHYQGLSDRSSLANNHGMLFVFDRADNYGFVMRRMSFSLDIIWLNNNKIVDIKNNLPPDNDDYPLVYYPIAPANTVLEVPAGTAKNNNWQIGQAVIINYALAK